MVYDARRLYEVWDRARGYQHFVLYREPAIGATLNAGPKGFDRPTSRQVEEWAARLERCEPDAAHCAVVNQRQIAALFRPCTEEDPASGEACECWRTWYDPLTGLPVAGPHHDRWERQRYWTVAPYDLPVGESVAALLVARQGEFWLRSREGGDLYIAPQGRIDYRIGYSGGGPARLARYLTKIVESSGADAGAGLPEKAAPGLLAWAEREYAGPVELSLQQLSEIAGR